MTESDVASLSSDSSCLHGNTLTCLIRSWSDGIDSAKSVDGRCPFDERWPVRDGTALKEVAEWQRHSALDLPRPTSGKALVK